MDRRRRLVLTLIFNLNRKLEQSFPVSRSHRADRNITSADCLPHKQPGLSKAPRLLRLTKASVDELRNVVFSCSNLKLINRADVSGSMERSCRGVYERKLSSGLGGGECSSPGGSWRVSVPVSVNQPHRPET
ncbi:unnamed protein product [Leuciscus chuanchicus]